jgi:hypothetical protein
MCWVKNVQTTRCCGVIYLLFCWLSVVAKRFLVSLLSLLSLQLVFMPFPGGNHGSLSDEKTGAFVVSI